MSSLSHVTIESKPAHSPFMAEWPQPFTNGDDSLAWFVRDDTGTTREVQRVRLTDEVYWCAVPVALTSQSFTVTTGASVGPATAWTTPDLTGFAMRWSWVAGVGGDGSVHTADFTDVTKRTILRESAYTHTERRYVMSKVTTVGTGNMVMGEGVLCHHVYLTYRSDLPNVVKVDVRMSNAAAEVQTSAASLAARGGGTKSTGTTQLNTIGFSDCDLVLPTVGTWAVLNDRQITIGGAAQAHTVIADALEIPVAFSSNAHCFPRKMATHRRFVLYKTSAGATAQQAQDLLDFKGLGRADDGGRGISWRNYHTVRACWPSKSLLPRLDIGGFTGGYAQAKTDCDNKWSQLHSASTNGFATYSGGGNDFGGASTARFGLFQFVGSDDVAEPGGSDIGTVCGGQHHVPAFVRFASLYSSHKLDGCGLYMYERTTGLPLRSYDFASAYAGGAVPAFETGVQFAGIRQPFSFLCQNNGGYETRGGQQECMAGWTKRDDSWPPHFRADSSWTSAGFFWMDGKWWPKRTSLWGTAPRSIWDFRCDYRPLLEYVPYSTLPDAAEFSGQPIFGRATDPGTPGSNATKAHLESSPTVTGTSTGDCWKDPEDNQHAIRIYRHLIALAWLGGDLMSIDDISMAAEWFGLEYTEVGMLRRNDTTDSFVQGTTNKCLGPGTTIDAATTPVALGPGQLGAFTRGRLAIQNATPHVAQYGMGRGDAWVATVLAADFALASHTRRDTGFPVYGLKTRARMMFEFIRAGIITRNGMSARLHASEITGIAEPYVPTGYITSNFACMQTTQELPKLYYGYFSLFKQLEGEITASGIADITSNAQVPFGPTGFMQPGTNSQAGVNTTYSDYWPNGPPANGQYAPFDFLACWNDTTNQPTYGYDLNGTACLGGFFHSGGHWPECAAMVEIAYRLGMSWTQLLPIVNALGAPNPGASRLARAPFWLSGETYYAPGMTALLQFDPGADANFTPPQTLPSVIGRAQPNPVMQGVSTVVGGIVTPGTNPTSTGLRVFANLQVLDIALSDAQELTETGVGTNVFTYTLATTTLVPQVTNVSVTVRDDQGRVNLDNFFLTITAATTAPIITLVSSSPSPVQAGSTLTLFADVIFGAHPTSTGVVVTADLSNLGGSATTPMLDGGVAPDLVAGDLRYTCSIVVAATFAEGDYDVEVALIDAQSRTALGSIGITVLPAPAQDAHPTVALSFLKNPILPGATLTAYALVTPGTGTNTIDSVHVNLSAIGGDAVTPMLDDGIAPDVLISDLIYSASFVTSGALAPGTYRLAAVAVDKLGLTGSNTAALTIIAAQIPTNPTLSAGCSENPTTQGATVTFTAHAEAGTAPPSTGLAVTLDTSQIDPSGGSPTELMNDIGGGDWSLAKVIPLTTPPGDYTMRFTVTDDQLRVVRTSFVLHLAPYAPPTSGTAVLVVRSDALTFLVPLNEAERLQVGSLVIQSSPDVSAEAGGQLPVTLADGTTVLLVPFRIITVPITPPTPIEEGPRTGAERQGQREGHDRAR